MGFRATYAMTTHLHHFVLISIISAWLSAGTVWTAGNQRRISGYDFCIVSAQNHGKCCHN